MPSQGFNDMRGKLFNVKLARFTAPWKCTDVFHKRIISFEETKKIIFETDWVKQEMDNLYQKRLNKLTKSSI